MSPGDELLDERHLAERAGTSTERIRELTDLGVLIPDEGRYALRDVMRARVVVELEGRGIDAHALAAAIASGDLTLGYLESAGRRPPRSDRTFAELAEELGMEFEALQRVLVAFGLPQPAPGEYVRVEDREALALLPVLRGAGLDETDVLPFARVWGDGVRRIAQYQAHYFHATVEETFRRRGLRDNEAFEAALREVGFRAGRSGEVLLAWLFRRHAEAFTAEHQFGHVETALDDAGVRRRAERGSEAVVFADLTGYTALTEEQGDAFAARVSLALAQLVNEIAAERRGQVVKLLGDGVLIHFRDPADAVGASLDLVGRVRLAGLPPAHIGVTAGPLIYDEGDYFGRAVNLAARISAHAGADQVLVSAEVVAGVPDRIRFVDAGDVDLKGFAQPVRIYEAAS